jgi:predicted nucleic acid-binding protein
VILNNTPLVALWSLNLLTILRDLYEEVIIPQTVYEEFLATERLVRQTALDEASWLKITPLIDPSQTLMYIGLDQGEAEVLALAQTQSARLVIMDERKGRRYAQRLGLPLTGTVGVLLTAKRNGLVPALAPLFAQLLKEGLFLAPELVAKALELAGENEPTTPHPNRV